VIETDARAGFKTCVSVGAYEREKQAHCSLASSSEIRSSIIVLESCWVLERTTDSMSKRANSVVEDEHVPVLILVECEDNVAQYWFKIRRELNQPLARACCRGPSELHLGGVGVVFVGSAKHVGQCQSLYTLLRSKKNLLS
jgi:hypothetical protein